jgi:YHS domain-containing protein
MIKSDSFGGFEMEKEIDPVCGMEVEPAQADGSSDHEGRTYYFCSPACKQQFDANPDRFIREDTLLERERGGI